MRKRLRVDDLELLHERHHLLAHGVLGRPALDRGHAVLGRDGRAVVPEEAVAQGHGVRELVGATSYLSTICGLMSPLASIDARRSWRTDGFRRNWTAFAEAPLASMSRRMKLTSQLPSRKPAPRATPAGSARARRRCRW